MRDEIRQQPEMSMRLFHDQRMIHSLELSRNFPVLDNLEDFQPMYDGIINDVLSHKITRINIIGASAAGKTSVAEQLLRKFEEEKKLKRGTRRGQRILLGYYSLGMGVAEADSYGMLYSPFGEFDDAEFDGMTEAMRVKLDYMDKVLARAWDGPILQLVDTVAVSHHYEKVGDTQVAHMNLGTDVVRDSIRRAKGDPQFAVRNIGIGRDPEVQDFATGLRDKLWEIPDDASDREVVRVLRRSQVKPDTQHIPAALIKRSMGNRYARERIDSIIMQQIYNRQEEIRKSGIDSYFPIIESPQQLLDDPNLLMRGDIAHIRLKLERDWGADPDTCFVGTNKKISKKRIPKYWSRIERYKFS